MSAKTSPSSRPNRPLRTSLPNREWVNPLTGFLDSRTLHRAWPKPASTHAPQTAYQNAPEVEAIHLPKASLAASSPGETTILLDKPR